MKKAICPKCRKSILMILRNWGDRKHWTSVEIHHHEDARRYRLGAATRPCTIRMSFERSQKLMDRLHKTGPSGLKLAQ